MTSWIQVEAEWTIVGNWRKGRLFYLHELVREMDPDGDTYLNAGTLRNELEGLVYNELLTKRRRRIVGGDGKARSVVYYEPTRRLVEYLDSFG